HFRNHTFRFGAALQAALTEPFVLGNGTDGVEVLLEVPGNEFAVAAYAALHVDTVVGVADGAHALGDLRTLRGEPLVLLASRVHVLLHLLHPRCHLGEAPWAALLRLLVGVVEGVSQVRERPHPFVAQRRRLTRPHCDDQSHAITTAAPLSCPRNSTSHQALTSAHDAGPVRQLDRSRPRPALGAPAATPPDSLVAGQLSF